MKIHFADAKKLFAILLTFLSGLPMTSTGVAGQGALAVAEKVQPYFTEPAISPDRSEIAFVSAGDVWTVRSHGRRCALAYFPSCKRIAAAVFT